MWLIARYRSVAAFSLRSSMATSSGGRTNLVPTMYAVKLALIDAAFRADEDGAEVFDLVKGLRIRFGVPDQIVVSNTFIKILRKWESKEKRVEGEEKASGPAFISSVAFREFCHYRGDLLIALDISAVAPIDRDLLRRLLQHVNYIGKRGSFFQLVDVQETNVDQLPPHFGYVEGDARERVSRDLVAQYLDDIGPDATFERISTFSDVSARLGRDRVLVSVALPLRRVASSRGYTLYERTVGGGEAPGIFP